MNIEDYIKINKDQFDLETPSENHLDNFESKLIASTIGKRRFSFRSLLKVAAITLLVIMSSLWITQNFLISNNVVQPLISLSDLSGGYEEVEVFYTSGINTALSQLDNYGLEGEQLKSDLIRKEFNELDSTYLNLQKELALQPDDERIIDAMVIHYQMKLKIINNILIQLKKVKTINPGNHETIEI